MSDGECGKYPRIITEGEGDGELVFSALLARGAPVDVVRHSQISILSSPFDLFWSEKVDRFKWQSPFRRFF